MAVDLFKSLFFTFILMGAASLQAASLFSGLSPKHQERWRLLYHYHKGESRVDEPSFFLHPAGKTEIAEEFKAATIAAELGEGSYGRFNQPFACAFPLRAELLKEWGFSVKEGHDCGPFKKWQDEVKPKALSIVFSTSYPNNPGSMFGHTFLRFHKNGKGNDLLDYGANYSAIVNKKDWGPVYAFKGLFGGYLGYFDLSPYYVLVNTYIHGESRDLIEYNLNLTPTQLRRVFSHLWELYNSSAFDYFFTWENCSFHLAGLLNVVLEKKLEVPSRWYYLPADLISAINSYGGLVSKIENRPSLKRQAKGYLERISNEQSKKVKIIADSLNRDLIKELKSVEEFDALISLLNYGKQTKKKTLEGDEKEFFMAALRARASLGGKSVEAPKHEFLNQPHVSHLPQKIAVGIGHNGSTYSGNLFYQSGYHDLLARDLGLDPWSEFMFLNGEVSLQKEELQVNRIGLIEITSLHPLTLLSEQLSWKVGVFSDKMTSTRDYRDSQRINGVAKMGITFGDRSWVLSALAGGVLEASQHYQDRYRANLSYELLAGVQNELGKILTKIEVRHDVRTPKSNIDYYTSIGLNLFLSRQSELRFTSDLNFHGVSGGKDFDKVNEKHSISLGVYF